MFKQIFEKMIHYNKKIKTLIENKLIASKCKSPEYWKARRALQSKRQSSLLNWLIDNGYEVEINLKEKPAKTKL